MGIPYAWAGKGKWDRAFETLDKARAVFPDLPELQAWAGYYHACIGRRAEAEESLRRLEETSKERYVCPLGPAMIHGSLGRIERMFELLHRGADERDFRMRGLRAMTLFPPLLATPRGAGLRIIRQDRCEEKCRRQNRHE